MGGDKNKNNGDKRHRLRIFLVLVAIMVAEMAPISMIFCVKDRIILNNLVGGVFVLFLLLAVCFFSISHFILFNKMSKQ